MKDPHGQGGDQLNSLRKQRRVTRVWASQERLQPTSKAEPGSQACSPQEASVSNAPPVSGKKPEKSSLRVRQTTPQVKQEAQWQANSHVSPLTGFHRSCAPTEIPFWLLPPPPPLATSQAPSRAAFRSWHIWAGPYWLVPPSLRRQALPFFA